MRIRNGFEEFFCLHSNLSNNNVISAYRPCLQTDVENYIFGSEIGSGFEEPDPGLRVQQLSFPS